jgi:hypothetical protein
MNRGLPGRLIPKANVPATPADAAAKSKNRRFPSHPR